MAQGRVDQADVPLALQNHDTRLQGLERQVGRWIYVTPVAPATAPPDAGTDPISPPFLNSWTNVAGKQAVRFRIQPATVVQIQGALQGGTIPSVVFTLPVGYRPPNAVPISFPSVSAGATYTGLIETNGDVLITGRGDGSGGFSSYLGAFSQADQGLTIATTTPMIMDNPPDVLVGSDIELQSDNQTIQINTDGWYSISFNPVINGYDGTSVGQINCWATSAGSPEYGWFGRIGSFITTIDIDGAVNSHLSGLDWPGQLYTLPPVNFGAGATFSVVARPSSGFSGTVPNLASSSAVFVLRER